MSTPALEFDDLSLAYVVRGTPRQVLRGVSFRIAPGESYGLVGESGCGKSTAAYAAIRYLPRNARILGGSVHLAGRDILSLSEAELREVRAKTASIVYQDPGQALNPTIRVGPQLLEAFTVIGLDDTQARERARQILDKVQIADPDSVMSRYPHQLSGGMQQRVVIAMALACDPKLLILDEPTTGLDATVEAEVLDLVRSLRNEYGTAVLFISHNLAAIRSMCDRVGVLYAGKLVEEGPAEQVFDHPTHPYTVGLLHCLPRHGSRKSDQRLETIPGFLPPIGADLPTCVFVDRCVLADDLCRTVAPDWTPVGEQLSRCHHVDRVPLMERAANRRGHRYNGRPHRRTHPGAEGCQQDVPSGRQGHLRVERRLTGVVCRRDRRARRRVRQRQDHVGAHRARHPRPRPDRYLAVRWRTAAARHAAASRRPGAGHPDRVPEPRLRAQPTAHSAPDHHACVETPGQDSAGSGRREASRDHVPPFASPNVISTCARRSCPAASSSASR